MANSSHVMSKFWLRSGATKNAAGFDIRDKHRRHAIVVYPDMYGMLMPGYDIFTNAVDSTAFMPVTCLI